MASTKTSIYAAIAANIAIAISKFIAATISGSSAMLSEGIHSLVDTGNGFLLLYGIKRSKKKPDLHHPLGYGQEVYFWSLVVAILIFAIGGGMSFYEGIERIRHPEPMGDPTLSYIVLALAIVFEGAALALAFKSFNKTRRGRGIWKAIKESKDPTSFAVLFEDAAALVGLLVAMAGIFIGHTFDMPIFDSVASLVIGVLLAVVAFLLAWESKDLLIGESADLEVRQDVERIVRADMAVDRMNPPVTLHVGPDDVLLALDVEFNDDLSPDEIEAAIRRIEVEIRKAQPIINRIFIEAKSLSKKPGGV